MYPTRVGSVVTQGAPSATSITVSPPTGLQVDDFIVFYLRAQSATVTDIVVPASVVRLGPAFSASNSSRAHGWYGYRVVDAGSIPSTFRFDLTGASSTRIAIHAMAFRYVATDRMSAFFDNYRGLEVTGGIQVPAYQSPATEGLTLVGVGTEFAAGADGTPTKKPTAYTALAEVEVTPGANLGRTYAGVYSRQQVAGTTEDFTILWPAGSAPSAESITLRGISGEAPVVIPGIAVKVFDGTNEVDGVAQVYDGTNLVAIDKLLSLPPDRITVDEWLAQPISYMAHRGGSGNWVEHTTQAYTNAVFHGAKNLEASVHYSSDGVPVMIHDPDTLSMTGIDKVVKNTTWAELSQMVVTKAGAGSGEKLQRLEWLIEHYAETHVITVEDKSYANMSRLIALFEQYYPVTGPSHFMIKAFGGGGTQQMVLPNSKGYKSWGYFYADIPPASIPDRTAFYTTIGIPFGSDQALYTETLNAFPNKKLIVHIVNSANGAALALARGAQGMQCSDVLGVIPKLNSLLNVP